MRGDIIHRNFEIGRVLHLKSEIRNLKLDGPIWDFGFRIWGAGLVQFRNFCSPHTL